MFQGFRDLLSKVEKRLDDIKIQPVNFEAPKFLKGEEVTSLFSTTTIGPALYRDNVNQQAGSSLLAKYSHLESFEGDLRTLHEQNNALAQKAEAADALIYPAALAVVNESKTVEDFKKQLDTIPALISDIERIRRNVDSLASRMEHLESLLDAQIVQHNQEQTQKQKDVFAAMVPRYQAQKDQQLAALKNETEIQKFHLEKKRAEDVKAEQARQVAAIEREYEMARQRLRAQDSELKSQGEKDMAAAKLREEYEKSLRAQMERYRLQEIEVHKNIAKTVSLIPSSSPSAASTPKKSAPSTPAASPAPALSIEQVSLDQNRDELDSFLSDQPLSPSSSSSSLTDKPSDTTL